MSDYDSEDEYPESGSGYESRSYDDGFEGFEGDMGEVNTSTKRAQYLVFTEAQLRERQEDAVSQVTSVLSIDEGDAVRVLRYCKWDPSQVNEEWFSNEEVLKKKVGLMDRREEASGSGSGREGIRSGKAAGPGEQCKICFDYYPREAMCGAACLHYFCKDCWAGYAANAINSGPSVLNLRCPLPDCSAAVPRAIISEVTSAADRARFAQYELRSYVEDNRKLTWCPAPNCEHAVECLVDIGAEPLDVACKCGATFCFQCKEEAHRPVDCKTVGAWIIKNSAESENLNWILANTKSCPKCKRPIEKNQGCMHMTCSQCKYEFCWLCQGGWQEHGERTGGFYACNRYEAAQKKGEYDEESQRREQAKNSLERYMHYYQRWAENDKARLAALEQQKATADDRLEKLSELTATPTSQLKFVTDAWAQVVDCRRILKWTYAYGYYHFGDQATNDKMTKDEIDGLGRQQEFFEFNQGQAESFLEALHGQVEKKLAAFMEAEDAQDFGDFRQNLIGLTDVTRSHFDKLVSELEKGLDNLVAEYGGHDLHPTMDVDDEAASKAGWGAKGKKATGAKRTKRAKDELDEALAMQGFWTCTLCTSQNTDLRSDVCSMCQSARHAVPRRR